MEALKKAYDSSSSSDSDHHKEEGRNAWRAVDSRQISNSHNSKDPLPLPPPPLGSVDPCNNCLGYAQTSQENRIRSFPHVEGNYALYVFIPVRIPTNIRKELVPLVRKAGLLVPSLHAVDVDVPLSELCQEKQMIEQSLLERKFHISLSRTVPIRVHQIDSIVAMLRQKFQAQRRFMIDFGRWEVFTNDDRTRTFLSMEVSSNGLNEITRQINLVNEVYRLHNLPEFYKNPRPHISLVWALGDASDSLKQAADELNRSRAQLGSSQRSIWTSTFNGIVCKIGKWSYKVCKFPVQKS
ncbi:U6 snRNA phosphodiesterase [Amborella trichopoda]|uniref:U6 snRNA phosphodiesterase n=1 Tax=Amborella trichopoda TaxID=13333 RepID=UPI0005D39F8E|nr:U6 snRNA phosphodiesterase [Amborella trichopoda]|eukprot:XP_011625622.1 U6 snRNA phosphodiesterase [Amborella trichopoda]